MAAQRKREIIPLSLFLVEVERSQACVDLRPEVDQEVKIKASGRRDGCHGWTQQFGGAGGVDILFPGV